MIIHIFFLNFLLVTQRIKSEIVLPFKSKENNIIIDSIPFGTPKQELSLLVDLSAMETWIPNKNLYNHFSQTFDPSKSKTFSPMKSQISFQYHDISISAKEISDTVLDEKNNMNVYLVNNIDKKDGLYINYSGVLGLRPLKNSQVITYSFIENLNQRKVINYKSMTISYLTDTNGEITFGKEIKYNREGLPEGEGNTYIDSCISSQDNPDYPKADLLFHCPIKEVSFNKKETLQYNGSLQRYIIFDSASRLILVPPKDLISIYLKYTNFSNNFCKIDNGKDNIPFLSCSKSYDISLLPSLSFLIGKNKVEIYAKDLFDYKDGEYFSKIKLSPNENLWFLGEPLIKNYKLTFDYEKLYVIIEKDLAQLHLNSQGGNDGTWNIFTIFLYCCLGVIGLIVIVFIGNRIRKRKFEKYKHNKKNSKALINMEFKDNFSIDSSIKELMPSLDRI